MRAHREPEPHPQAQAEKNSLIWADPANNALVITAPPKVMRQIMAIIDKLDIRRPQVLVEAIIADVDVSKDAELGVNWAAFSQGSNVPVAGFVSPVGGSSIVDLAQAVENPANVTSALLNGTTLGIGKIGGAGVNFAAVLRAIETDTHTNVIATPSAVTMDDQEAELKVAQEVPFVTGQFTSTGSASNGAVNPFQTIQNQEVGTILKVTPTISAEGTAVMMKLSIESSSLAPTSTSTTNPTTNKRTVTTNVAHRRRWRHGAGRIDPGHEHEDGGAGAAARLHSDPRARLQDAHEYHREKQSR